MFSSVPFGGFSTGWVVYARGVDVVVCSHPFDTHGQTIAISVFEFAPRLAVGCRISIRCPRFEGGLEVTLVISVEGSASGKRRVC